MGDDYLARDPVIRLQFDVSNVRDCERVVDDIALAIMRRHGLGFMRKFFSEYVPSPSYIKKQKNALMMINYIVSGLGVDKCAALMAEDNKGLPPSDRHGPYGSTSAETMKKQIQREKKRMARDADYRKSIERAVKERMSDIS